MESHDQRDVQRQTGQVGNRVGGNVEQKIVSVTAKGRLYSAAHGAARRLEVPNCCGFDKPSQKRRASGLRRRDQRDVIEQAPHVSTELLFTTGEADQVKGVPSEQRLEQSIDPQTVSRVL